MATKFHLFEWFLSIAKIIDFRDPENALHFPDIQIPCNV